MAPTSIFTDFLAELGVPHTREYSDSQFEHMTFRSLFGFSKLLERYGIANEAIEVPDKEKALGELPVPFLARFGETFVIVRQKTGEECTVDDGIGHKALAIKRADFIDGWSGVALIAYPGPGSAEPCYCRHSLFELAQRSKKWVLIAASAFIFLYLFISNCIYSHVTTVLLTLINAAGLFVTYELVLKSLNIHSDRADKICGLIDRTGCGSVLSTKASKFFGLFGWSEVGFSYFGVSLACMLVFPQYIGYLALVNACCCPFSFWSVWYQKYRAKAWCTLCLITQGCLWASLLCYTCGGWFAHSFPLHTEFAILCASYVAALLAINAVTPLFDKNTKDE